MATLDDLLSTLWSIRDLATSLGNVEIVDAMTAEILSLVRTEPTEKETQMFVAVGAR